MFIGLALALMSQNVVGQAGAPDPGFQVQPLYTNLPFYPQPDGKILLTGTFAQGNTFVNILRLNPDGTVDPTFRGTDESTANEAFSPTFANGYTYLTAVKNNPSTGAGLFVLQRYLTSTGQVDAAFGAVTVPGQNAAGYQIQPDGKILVWGDSVYRRNADGTVDTSFTPSVLSYAANVAGLSVTSSGSICVWGSFSSLDNVPMNGIARLKSDGTVDTTFQSGLANHVGVTRFVQEAAGTVLLSTDSTQVQTVGGAGTTLIRLNADGSLSKTFQSPAFQENALVVIGRGNGAGLMETPDQKILVWGNFNGINQTPVPGYAELNSDGSIDTSFVANATISGIIANIALQPDGKLVIGGQLSRSDLAYTVPLVRLNSDGSLDTSFDLVPENQVTYSRYLPTAAGASGDDNALLGFYDAVSFLIQPDGKILTCLVYVTPSTQGGGTISIGHLGSTPTPTGPSLVLRYEGDGNYPPHRPRTIALTSLSPQATQVIWNAVTDETGYQIERENAGQWVAIGTAPADATSYIDPTADGVTNFPYRVEAKNANGLSVPSPVATVPMLQPFTAFQATVISPTWVGLTWGGVTGEWGYEIYRVAGTVNTNYIPDPASSMTKVGTAPSSATSYVDTTAVPDQTYTYVVLARNVAGTITTQPLSVTMPDALPPVSPAELQAAPSAGGGIDVVWEASPWSNSYQVERSSNGGVTWQIVATLGYNASRYIDTTGLSAGQAYDYRITASNAEGSSAVSTTISSAAPTSTWQPPGAVDFSFAPNPPLTGVKHAKLSPSGDIYYDLGNLSGNSNMLYEVSPTGAALPFSPYFEGVNINSGMFDYWPVANNEIVVSGYVQEADFVERLDAHGGLDATFTSPMNGETVVALTPLRGGGFLAIGQFSDGGIPVPSQVERINDDGAVDTSFQIGYPIWNDQISHAAEQSDGKMIVLCNSTTLIRLLTNGQQDPTFGTAGQVVIGGGSLVAQVVQADDKIILGGNFTTVDDGSGPVARASLVRLTADGKVDPAFHVGTGIAPLVVVSPVDSYGHGIYKSQQVNSLTLDAAGRVLVQGAIFQYDSIPCSSLIRLLPDGEFDPSFDLPQNFDSSNFLLNNDGMTFYAGPTLRRYFYGPINHPAPIAFTGWQAANSVTGSPAASALHDGVPNLLKYLYNINPTRTMGTADRAALPTIGTVMIGQTPCATLTYRENAAITGISVVAETSTDLIIWTPVPSTNMVQVGNDSTTGDPIMQAQVPMTGSSQYLRLNVSQ